jgi:hypothetical protein
MADLNHLLHNVIKDAHSVGFPVPDNLERKIYIDAKTYDRVGACYRYTLPDRYEIHLSEDTQRAKTHEIKNIMAHEVLHANFMTMEHNCFWKMYQQRMNDMLGYNIKIRYSWHDIIE